MKNVVRGRLRSQWISPESHREAMMGKSMTKGKTRRPVYRAEDPGLGTAGSEEEPLKYLQ